MFTSAMIGLRPATKPITKSFGISIKGIIGGWAAFGGMHLFLNGTETRTWLTNKLGSENRFMFLYGTAAAATLFTTTYFFWLGRKSGPYLSFLYNKEWVHPVSTALKAAGGFALIQSLVTPSPSAYFQGFNPYVVPMAPDAIYPEEQPHVQGIIRITRHPIFMATSFISLACLLKSHHLVDVLFWSFPVVFPYVAALQQDMRHQKLRLLPKSYFDHTSVIPFGAIISGKQSFDQMFHETFTIGNILISSAIYLPFSSFWRVHVKRFWTKLTI